MKQIIIIMFFLSICFSCDSQERHGYTFEEFQAEFQDAYDVFEMPMGTYFWDEFKDLEALYNLSKDEAKLLGEWKNVTFIRNMIDNYYLFFPNKLFVLIFTLQNTKIISAEEVYFDKGVGTWEIVNGMVKITIHAITTEDRTKERPNNRGVFFIERPYSVDFIRIDDIGEQGFTKRPINEIILSPELQNMVTIIEPNRTNNLYIRSVYALDLLSGNPYTIDFPKRYGYFRIVPELAQERLTGLEVATNREHIEKYIFPLRP